MILSVTINRLIVIILLQSKDIDRTIRPILMLNEQEVLTSFLDRSRKEKQLKCQHAYIIEFT